jgi:predicted nucleotidyltransferase component of viral defense system
VSLITDRLSTYRPTNAIEQEVALAEIMQQIILFALARTDFFERAMFHGGTCLRIFWNLRRFSEDLDFVLKTPSSDFVWKPYLDAVLNECNAFGIDLEVRDRAQATGAVKSAFLKTNSIGKLLVASLPHARNSAQKIAVKVEIDTHPPDGADGESRFLIFPGPAAVTVQTLPSSFAGKIHALLCRKYIKGRDWFDLLWYAERGIQPNLALCRSAIHQVGPWQGQATEVTNPWLTDRLAEKVRSIDWSKARIDVARFLTASDQRGIEIWSEALFIDAVDRLRRSWSV